MAKELTVRIAQGSVMYEVFYDQGGNVPQVLGGLYTSEEIANYAIDVYLEGKKKLPPIKKRKLTPKNAESTI